MAGLPSVQGSSQAWASVGSMWSQTFNTGWVLDQTIGSTGGFTAPLSPSSSAGTFYSTGDGSTGASGSGFYTVGRNMRVIQGATTLYAPITAAVASSGITTVSFSTSVAGAALSTSTAFTSAAVATAVRVRPTHNIWVPPSIFILRAGTPVLAVQGSQLRYQAWAFDKDGIESITGEFLLPEDWVGGNLTVKMYWTNLAGGAGDVVWGLFIKEIANAADLDDATGETTPGGTVTAPAQGILKVTTFATTVPVSAASSFFRLVVQRTANDGADSLANDAGFIGCEIEYTAAL